MFVSWICHRNKVQGHNLLSLIGRDSYHRVHHRVDVRLTEGLGNTGIPGILEAVEEVVSVAPRASLVELLTGNNRTQEGQGSHHGGSVLDKHGSP